MKPLLEDNPALIRRLHETVEETWHELPRATLMRQAAEALEHTHAIAVGGNWEPIETAPHGEPGYDVGSRDPSEYFIAWVASKYPVGRKLRVVRRIYDNGYAFADYDRDSLYVDDFFSHWQPLPEGPQ